MLHFQANKGRLKTKKCVLLSNRKVIAGYSKFFWAPLNIAAGRHITEWKHSSMQGAWSFIHQLLYPRDKP
jgi:hypothetical protein